MRIIMNTTSYLKNFNLLFINKGSKLFKVILVAILCFTLSLSRIINIQISTPSDQGTNELLIIIVTGILFYEIFYWNFEKYELDAGFFSSRERRYIYIEFGYEIHSIEILETSSPLLNVDQSMLKKI